MSSDHHSYSAIENKTLSGHKQLHGIPEETDVDISQSSNLSIQLLQWPSSQPGSPQMNSATLRNSLTPIERALPERPRSLKEGWRKIIAWNCLANLVALIANLVLLVWGCLQPLSDRGTHIIWSGDQDNQRTVEIGSHIGINLVSTIILAGSNYTLQVLLAPSRKDIDCAHEAKRSLDIGISSSRNWSHLCWKRKLLYLLLLILMLPIHLFYNSVIFSTLTSFNLSSVGVVTQDFLQVPPSSSNTSIWNSVAEGQQWTQFTNKECYDYLQLNFNLEYPNLLIVTNLTSSSQNSTSFYTLMDFTYEWTPPGSWISTFQMTTGQSAIGEGNSLINLTQSSPIYPDQPELHAYTFELYQCQETWNTSIYIGSTLITTEIEYCWAEITSNFKTVELIPQLLIVVIVCNVLKIVVLCSVIFSKFNPLLTTGDAIASFLDVPDQTTEDIGPISTNELLAAELRNRHVNLPARLPAKYSKPWKVRHNRYLHGSKTMRWKLTVAGCFLFLVLMIGGLLTCSSKYTRFTGNDISFGSLGSWASTNAVFQFSSVIASALLVNSPQLVLAITYMAFNSVWTNMLLSEELVNYSDRKQGLRVTRPEGQQRGTLFLSLPIKYFTPLFLLGLASHWVLSQTLFIVYIRVFDSDGAYLPSDNVHGVGYFFGGLVILVCLLGFLNLVTFCFGMRKFRSAGPIIGSNSLCISAACHPFTRDGQRESVKKLQYGVILQASTGRSCISFTSGEVRRVVEEEIYGQCDDEVDKKSAHEGEGEGKDEARSLAVKAVEFPVQTLI